MRCKKIIINGAAVAALISVLTGCAAPAAQQSVTTSSGSVSTDENIIITTSSMYTEESSAIYTEVSSTETIADTTLNNDDRNSDIYDNSLSPVLAFTGTVNTDGYEIEYTVSVTNWLKASDPEYLQQAWKAAGAKGDVPDIKSFSDYGNDGFTSENAAVAFGNISFKNTTAGSDIISDDPVSFSLGVGASEYFDNYRTKIYIGYGSSPTMASFSKYAAFSPKMTSNKWGPVPFMIVYSSGFTDDNPDGDPALKYFKINFSSGSYDYIAITLPVSEEENENLDTLYPVIPNCEYSTYSRYDDPIMSDGLFRIQDPDSKLYGFIDSTGKIVIDKEYVRVDNFSGGRSIATNMRGKRGVIDTKGKPVVPFEYSTITDNGVYFFAGDNNDSSDVYDYNGIFLATLPVGSQSKSLVYAQGNKLLAIQEKNKWKLVTPQNEITDALYDSIIIEEDSIFAVLKYGSQEALATEKGIVYDLGKYTYNTILRQELITDRYIAVIDRNENGKWHCAISNENGIFTDFFEFIDGFIFSTENFVTIFDSDYGMYFMYDIESKQSYYQTANFGNAGGRSISLSYSCSYTIPMTDGTFRLLDGTLCSSIENVGSLIQWDNDYFAFSTIHNKYGLYYRGEIVLPAAYDTVEDAIAAFGVYKIAEENGKPIVAFGNEKTGYTPVIQYYKDKLYFDAIIDVENGYYACLYDETWYLLNAATFAVM